MKPAHRISFAFFAVILVGGIFVAQEAKPLPPLPSPGSAIQAAEQSVAKERSKSPVEILSDTQGVDFGPYLDVVIASVRKNWYALIPADEQHKKGKLAIEFAILKNGSIGTMSFIGNSGDIALDRPAWEGIKAAAPFQALPQAFKGDRLVLRFRFYYNPDEPDHRFTHAHLIETVAEAHTPKYPKAASKARVDGVVRLEVKVTPSGKVDDVKVLEGDPRLAEASTEAIRKWRFHPAQRDTMPVEDSVRVKVEFRLEGQQVRAQVVWPEPVATP